MVCRHDSSHHTKVRPIAKHAVHSGLSFDEVRRLTRSAKGSKMVAGAGRSRAGNWAGRQRAVDVS